MPTYSIDIDLDLTEVFEEISDRELIREYEERGLKADKIIDNERIKELFEKIYAKMQHFGIPYLKQIDLLENFMESL